MGLKSTSQLDLCTAHLYWKSQHWPIVSKWHVKPGVHKLACLKTAELARHVWAVLLTYGLTCMIVPSVRTLSSLPSGNRFFTVWSGKVISLWPSGKCFSGAESKNCVDYRRIIWNYFWQIKLFWIQEKYLASCLHTVDPFYSLNTYSVIWFPLRYRGLQVLWECSGLFLFSFLKNDQAIKHIQTYQ